jgi:hypothetical protein
MAGGAEVSGFTGKGEKKLASAFRAANPCKAADGVGTVEVTLHYLAYHRSEVSIAALKEGIIPGEEGIEMGGEHPVEHSAFGMPLPVE